MSQLEIKKIPQEDGSKSVELQIAGITKASFSMSTEMTIDQVTQQFERALQGLPKQIIVTINTAKELLELLIPELSQRMTILPSSLSEVENHLHEVVEKLEHHFREAFSVPNSWPRIQQLLSHNNYYNYPNLYFDFGDFLLGNGVFSTLYNGNYTRTEAKRILENNMHTGNIWDKTLDKVINVLIQSGFPISE